MRLKRIAIAAGALVILLVAGVLAAVWLVDVNGYRPQIQTLLREQLNRDVSIGRLGLSLWPLGVRVEDTVIGESPAFPTGRPFAQVAELYVRPKVWPLLRGGFELASVEVREPQVELVRANGVWNFDSLGSNEPSSSDSALVLEHFAITSGQIGLTEMRPASEGPGTRVVYRNIDLELDDFAPKRAFDFSLRATLPGSGTQRVSLRGEAGPIADPATMTPLDATAELEQVSVGGLQQFLQLEALDGTDAVISGTAAVKAAAGEATATGSLRFADTTVRKVAIGYPIALDFDVSHATPSNVLTVKRLAVLLDRTPIGLSGTVDLSPEIPVLDVRATAADASLAEAARLASAFGVAFGAGTQVAGTATADVQARGPATLPALDGSVRLRDVSISGADIKQPVRTPAIDVTLTPDAVRTNEFTVTTGGTSVGVRAAATKYTTPVPVIDAHVKAAGDLGEVLNMAKAWGVAAADGMSGSGPLTLDVAASGPTDGLTFSGSGTVRNATVRSPALTEAIGIRRADVGFTRDSAILDQLAATVGKTTLDGRLTVRNFAAPQVDFQLAADRLDVRELQALLVPSPAGAPTAPKEPAAASDSLLLQTTGSGRLSAGSIVYDALVLENVQATATLDRGVISLSPVTAALFGGSHNGAITVDARKSPASFSVGSQLEKVDANRLASATTSLRDVITGALGTTLRMTFAGDGADSIARSLNGTMSLNLADGTIANMDLRSEIASVAKFITGQPRAERSTRIAALRGDFKVTNGLARTENLTASIEGGTLGAAGTVNLVDQSLDLRLTAVLSREYSQKAGGSGIGGFMTTALSNQQGELVVPLLVSGTMSKPRFAPDVQRFTEMRVKNLVPSLRNPGSLTGGILGAIGGQGDGQSGGAAGAGKALGGILGAVTGRGQAPAPPPADGSAPAQPPADTAKPDRGKQVEDALRGILGGRRKPAEEKPAEKPAK
jgi:uncharacterized protein involved in outer membrane biogenesis